MGAAVNTRSSLPSASLASASRHPDGRLDHRRHSHFQSNGHRIGPQPGVGVDDNDHRVYGSTSNSPSHSKLVSDSIATPTFLQPRVAAVLGVSKGWHPVLFACRLLSICPSIWWSASIALSFLVRLCAVVMAEYAPEHGRWTFENRLLLTEMFLAIIWCGCSGYLSFFFTDCLMSRWLLNYTPIGTVFRLLSINLLNYYLQSCTLSLSGSYDNPLLLLMTWICITSTLTLVYHITQRKINIRKETATSISVFSLASYVSMIALLLQLHWERTDWLKIPIVSLAQRILVEGSNLAFQLFQYANATSVTGGS